MTIMGPTTVKACPNCDQLVREDSYLTMTHMPSLVWADGYEEGPMASYASDIVKCPTCNYVFWIRDAKEVGEYDSMMMYDLLNNPEFMKEHNPVRWERIHKDKKKLDRELHLYQNSTGTDDPTESDCLTFLENTTLTKEQERYVRTLAWQKANDNNRGAIDSIALGWYILGDASLKDLFKEPPDPDWREFLEQYKGIFRVNFKPEQIDNLKALIKLVDDSNPHDLILKAEIFREIGDFDEAYKTLNSLFPDTYKQRIIPELHESYLSKKKVSEEYDLEFEDKSTEELYASHIERFLYAADAIKLLCDHNIVCVADIGLVIKETNKLNTA